MSAFQPFYEDELYTKLRLWREGGVSSLRITCGPLLVFASYDYGNAIWRIHGIRRGQILAGTTRFYSPRYSIFHCIYGIMRTQGLESQDWERGDTHSFSFHIDYLTIIHTYMPYLRVKFQYGVDKAIFIQNLLSHTYMKITPIISSNGSNNAQNPHPNNDNSEDQGIEDDLTLPSSVVLGMDMGFVSVDEDSTS